jgi:predicted amidohydrolase YtcJ
MEPHGVAMLEAGVSSGFGNDRLRIGPCKFMVDGSSSGPTAATRTPYASQPSFSGFLQMTQEELDKWVEKARLQDFQVTMHAVGDRAIEMCLNAFDRADRGAPSADPRHRIEHCAMCPPDLIRRVREQGVIPVVQPTFLWDFGEGYIRDYGPVRGAQMFPLRSFLDAGIVVAGSTDSPVSRREPLFAIQQAVTRRTRQGEVCGEGQQVSVSEAVRLFTYGSAYATREEHVLGSLEPGKLADLVVLAQGLEDGPPETISEIPVDLTMLDGTVAASRR